MQRVRTLTDAQARDLAAADLAADEAHERWNDALAAAEQAEFELVAALAAYQLKRIQYGVRD